MNTLYEHCYYLMRQTKNPKYLDFYDLGVNDLDNIEGYCGQTVRFQDKWFFVEMKKKYFYTEKERKEAGKYQMKRLYRKPENLF